MKKIITSLLLTLIVAGHALPANAQFKFKTTGNLFGEIVQDIYSGDVILKIDTVEKLRIKADGRMIVQSGVLVGDQATCDWPNKGTIKYVTGTNTWKFCDGTGWQDFLPGATTCGVYSSGLMFTDQVAVATSTVINSNTIQVDTDSCAATISISGGGSSEFRTCSDAACTTVLQNWTSSNTTISDGQYIQLRQTSSASANTRLEAEVIIGTVLDRWSVKTAPSGYTVFVSSVSYNGLSLDGIGGADHKCQTLADAAGLEGRFIAWITDSSTATSPSSRFHQSTLPYRKINGVTVANNWTDLTDGTIASAINMTDTSGVPGSTEVITNTTTGGARNSSTNNCFDYAHVSASTFEYGSTSQTNSQWTFVPGTRGCGLGGRLYCFQQPDEVLGVPGVDFKRIFISSASYLGADVDGIGGADAKCNSLASAAGLTGYYRAWVSDSTAASAPSNALRGFTQATVPYRNVGGKNRKIANNWTDLVDGALYSGINYDETGAYVGFSDLYTNVTTAGAQKNAINHCNNWTSSGGYISQMGRSGIAGAAWTDFSTTASCNAGRKLLCVEQ